MKNILVVNNLKIECNGFVSSRREKNPIQTKLEICISDIEKDFSKRKLKVKLPPFFLTSNMSKDLNTIYDKAIDKFYINYYFVRNNQEKVIKKVLLDSLSVYINNKISYNKKSAIREIYNTVLTNKKLLGKNISGNNLLIPSGKNYGIMIPKISLSNLNEFSLNITSLYLKNLYPMEISDKNLKNVIDITKDVFNNINI